MRHHAFPTLLAVATLGLASSACSLLGTYANSASSMMAQPGAAASPGAAAPSPGSSTPAAPSSSPSTASAGDSTPSTVSVTLVNACSETVKLFFGDKPKFGSGRYDSLSSNTRTSHTFKPGDQLWIVDESQNGIANVKIEASTREVEVASGCQSLRAR